MDPSNFSGKPLWLLAGSATITAGANAHQQFKQTRVLQFQEAYKIVKDYSEGKIDKGVAIESIVLCVHPQSLNSLPSINFRLYTTLGNLDFDFSLLTENTIYELLLFLKLAPNEIQKIHQNVRQIRTQNSFDRVCIIDPISYQISPMNQYIIFSSTFILNIMTGLLVEYTIWNHIKKFVNSRKA